MMRLLLPSLLALAFCSCRLSPTIPVNEIIASDVPDHEAHTEFDDRVRELSESKRALSNELYRAGFRFHSRYEVGCGVWLYPVANPSDPKALRANVKMCQGFKPEEVEIDDTDFQHWPDKDTDNMQSFNRVVAKNPVKL